MVDRNVRRAILAGLARKFSYEVRGAVLAATGAVMLLGAA
jgi:hypothetical protein